MTRQQIEKGNGFFADGAWTVIWQHEDDNVFDTSDKNAVGRPGWHLAGGGCLLKNKSVKLEWCDLRGQP